MGVLRHWGRRFLLPFSTQSDQAIADEIRSHLSLHTDELMAEGQPPGIAHRNALISLGGVAQTLDRCRRGVQRGSAPFRR